MFRLWIFQGFDHSDFLQLNGKATISHDRLKIEELWEFVIKTWFTEGVDDPRITVIKVASSEGYYWDNKHGNTVAGVKMRIGAALERRWMIRLKESWTCRLGVALTDLWPV